MNIKNLTWLWISALVVVIDQFTKHLAVQHLSFLKSASVFSFINWTLDYNAGAAFSFLSSGTGWQRWFFVVIAFVIIIVIVSWLLKTEQKNRCQKIAMAFILGGAIGNLIDRVMLGYVVDFIDVFYKHWHWPIFNVADSAITIGVLVLMLNMLVDR